MQTPYFTLTSTSSLQLHSTNQNTVFQANKHTEKGNPKGSPKKKKKLCSSSAKVKTEKLCSSSATTGNSEAIQKIIQKVWILFPFFVFYSITIYRFLKRLHFSLISNLFLQSLEFCLFDFCILFGCFLLCLCFFYVSWIQLNTVLPYFSIQVQDLATFFLNFQFIFTNS